MTWRGSTSRVFAAALALAVATAGILAAPATTQAHASTVDDALIRLAETVGGDSSLLDRHLQAIGFPTPSDDWRHYPAIRKLEAAYRAADVVGPRNGERMLAALSSSLAQQYAAVRVDPLLARWVASDVHTVAFSAPPSASGPQLPSPVRKAIERLADYGSGSALGGMSGVLQRYAGLSAQDAYRLLSASDSNQDALASAWRRLPEREREERLRRFVADVDHVYASARDHTPELDPFRAPHRRDRSLLGIGAAGPWEPPASGPVGGGGGSGPSTRPPDAPGTARDRGPHGPAGSPSAPGTSLPDWAGRSTSSAVPASRNVADRAALRSTRSDEYRAFRSRWYSTPASRSFGTIRGVMRGWGGVVFGAEVRGPKRIKVASYGWLASDGAIGYFLFWDSRGEMFRSPPMSVSEAAAAFEIVNGELREADGDGIGIFGLDVQGQIVAARQGDDGLLLAPRFPTVVHPALCQSVFGWAAMLGDILPGRVSDLRRQTASGGEQALERWEECQNDEQCEPANWKVLDAPMAIRAKGDELVPSGPDTSHPELLLDFVAFSDSGRVNPEATKRFVELLPHLVQADGPYAHLNRLAGTVALLRWASRAGRFVGAVPSEEVEKQLAAPPVPESVILYEGGIEFAPGFDRTEERLRLLERLGPEVERVTEALHREVGTTILRAAELSADFGQLVPDYEALGEHESILSEMANALPAEAKQELERFQYERLHSSFALFAADTDAERQRALRARARSEARIERLYAQHPSMRETLSLLNRIRSAREALRESAEELVDIERIVPEALVAQVHSSQQSSPERWNYLLRLLRLYGTFALE